MQTHISGVTLAIGKNDIVYDMAGKEYIDFTSGIFATNIGHSNEYVIDTLEQFAQPGRLMHTYTFDHPARDAYLIDLQDFTGYPYAYLFSAGTEATEAAWKVMSRLKNRPAIVGMGQENNAFHGRTMGARIMAGSEGSHLYAQPPEKTCGIVMEPYNPLLARKHPQYQIDKIKAFVKEYDFALCLDEIQAGFGRTGKMFGYEHYKLDPDYVCIGKGMGNGYPISGLLSKHDLDLPEYELSSTHGGDPLACAIGSAVIQYFKDHKVIGQAYRKGAVLKKELESLQDDFDLIFESIGMVAALIFKSQKQADAAVQAAARAGVLLVHTGQSSVKIGPPLTITTDNLTSGCAIVKEAVRCVFDTSG